MSRVVSVNVSGVREIEWRGRPYRTGFLKEPVPGAWPVRGQGLDGDVQADLRVHGGPDKAVYAYPLEHYDFWSSELGEPPLSPGAFGENLTVEGLLEHDVCVGDELDVGSTRLRVTRPRHPCVKLSARFGRADMPKRFVEAGRPGYYLRVLREGTVSAGDDVARVRCSPGGWTVRQVFRLETGGARVRPAVAPELDAAATLLVHAGLPTEGFPDETPVVLVAAVEGRVAGTVALELHGRSALLRSAVVDPAVRGRGLGRALTHAALERAWATGARSVSLLTETAEGFFAGVGFRRVARADLAPELAGSAELRGACPDSAVAMRLKAGKPPQG